MMTWCDNKSVSTSLKILRNQIYVWSVLHVSNSVQIPVIDTVENPVLRTTVEAVGPVLNTLQERLNDELV